MWINFKALEKLTKVLNSKTDNLDIYTLLYIKQKTTKDLLDSTETLLDTL